MSLRKIIHALFGGMFLFVGVSHAQMISEPFLVKDFNTNTGSSSAELFYKFKELLIFRAVDIRDNMHIWRSDGTEEGTFLLKEIGEGGEEGRVRILPQSLNIFTDTTQSFIIVHYDENEFITHLWGSDGTSEGTQKLDIVLPGYVLYPFYNLCARIGDELYYLGIKDEGIEGVFRTDGTQEGSSLVKVIPVFSSLFNVRKVVTYKKSIYFQVEDELWTSDGTPEGTKIFYEFTTNTIDGRDIRLFKDKLIFSVEKKKLIPSVEKDSLQFWMTDGTLEGTQPTPIEIPNFNDPQQLAITDSLIYFFSDRDPAYGPELWSSDGTEEGTQLVKDIKAGPEGSFGRITKFNNLLIFGADDGIHGLEPWVSDGTEEGTKLLKDIYPGPEGKYRYASTTSDRLLFMFIDDGIHGEEWWLTDGTTEGTRRFTDIFPLVYQYVHTPVVVNNNIFLSAPLDSMGYELWKADINGENLQLVRDINPGESGSILSHFVSFGEKLFFVAFVPETGSEPWISDGTEEGTYMIKDIALTTLAGMGSSYNPLVFQAIGKSLLVGATDNNLGTELWINENIDTDTFQIVELVPGNGSSNPKLFGSTPSEIFITAKDSFDGQQLWVSDGTIQGTEKVPGSKNNWQENVQVLHVGDNFYYNGNDPENGYELWAMNANTREFRMVKDINPGNPSSYPSINFIFGDKLVFMASHNDFGEEPWISDGTEDGTYLLRDISQGTQRSTIYHFVTLDDTLYFLEKNTGIWKSDGSPEGTQQWLPEAKSGSYFYPDRDHPDMISASDRIFFLMPDSISGVSQIWTSDGNKNNIRQITQFSFSEGNPSLVFNYPKMYTWTGSHLFFQAYTDSSGWELWVSDGTLESTRMLKDINSGQESGIGEESSVPQFMSYENLFFFVGDDAVHGPELWVTDGTSDGTKMVSDLFPGRVGSNPDQFNIIGDKLFFAASSEKTGRELFAISLADTVTAYKPYLVNNKDFLVYPNPFSSQLTIENVNRSGGQTEISMYNLNGQRVATIFSGILPKGKYSIQWKAKDALPEGIYFIRWENTEKLTVKRVLLNH